MEDLKILESELVPVYETSSGEKVVYGTELHAALNVKSRFNDWIRNRLNDCEAVKNENYESFTKNLVGGGQSKEYIIKLDTAKEMAMLERNEKGKQVRRYFIAVEKKYKEFYPRVPVNPIVGLGLSPQLEAMINLELKQKKQGEKLAALEDRTNQQAEAIQAVKEAMASPEAEESFSSWTVRMIEAMAKSPAMAENQYRYQTVWGESYKRLEAKAGCRLEVLLKNAKKRAAERGATASTIKSISKLSIIGDNKRLKELYIACIREMLIAYCVEVA